METRRVHEHIPVNRRLALACTESAKRTDSSAVTFAIKLTAVLLFHHEHGGMPKQICAKVRYHYVNLSKHLIRHIYLRIVCDVQCKKVHI
jgi:hypothetical protein